MPGLFSRKPKGSKSSTLLSSSITSKTSPISSSDLARLGLHSPTPSTADAQMLPRVPTKDDLPPPPPISKENSFIHHQPQLVPIRSSSFENGFVPHSAGGVTEFGKSADSRSSNNGTRSGFLSPPLLSTYPSNGRLRSPTSGSQTLTTRQSNSRMRYVPSRTDDSVPDSGRPSYAYGYTNEGWNIQLEAVRVLAILEACGKQIRKRGLDNPLIFSSMALDLSPTNVASLIRSYTSGSNQAASRSGLPSSFLEEIEYGNPHDLAAVIKWAFARMGRVLAVPVPSPSGKRGEVREEMVYVQQRGFVDLEVYNVWRDNERRQQYPTSAFKDFVSHLAPENARLLTALFSLLSSTAAYSFKNGMMPSKLSKHFGVLLFGLPEDESFARTYDAYVRASNATEHLFLAYIRSQGTTTVLPPKLTQHVSGYPNMLTAEMTLPSKTAKLVPVTQIERTVRLYSPDLVQTACETDLTVQCREWDDCHESNDVLGKDPQLSDRFRKLVNLRGNLTQGRKLGATRQADGAINAEDVKTHGSLVNKQWDDFLSDGFAAPDAKKLDFDLNESIRKNRGNKRDTMQWSDFTKSGFADEGDDLLSSALSFDDTLKSDVQNWPAERDQLHAKLRARQNHLPSFHYDTTPRLVTSPSQAGSPEGKLDMHPISRIDEGFVDVWADYLIGNGWSNRDELTHRTANFVIVQYKSRPNASTVGSQAAGSSLSAPTSFKVVGRKDESIPEDERVDAAWFVIQEVVPAQYRAELETIGSGKSRGHAMIRKLTLFRSKKDKPSGVASAEDDGVDDVFRPGPGGTTKRIMLSEQLTGMKSKDDVRASLNGTRRADSDSGEAALGSRQSNDSSRTYNQQLAGQGHTQFRSEGHASGNGGNKLISTLRAKSIRVVKSARRGASSPSLSTSRTADARLQRSVTPEATPKLQQEQGNKAAVAYLSPQRGDISVDRSFTSADFETRSINDDNLLGTDYTDATEERYRPTFGIAAPKRKSSRAQAGLEGKGSTARDRDDAWIDIMLKANGNRLHGQDAPMPGEASLSVPVGANTATSTPRAAHSPLFESDDTFEGRDDRLPRSSTPPLSNSNKGTPDTIHVDDLGISRIDSRASSVADDADLEAPSEVVEDKWSGGKMAFDMQMKDVSSVTPSAARDGQTASDPVAAARAALRSRDTANAQPRAAPQIDTKKLVESLRAGLSPIEAVRASKDRSRIDADTSASPTPPAVQTGKYRDPFAKDPIAGRVADVASKFGGKTKGSTSSGPGNPSSPSSSTFVRNVSGSHDRNGGDLEKPLPDPLFNGGAEDGTSSADVGREDARRASLDSYGNVDDEIYPEDAASNIDPRDHYQSQYSESDAGGDVEHLSDIVKPYSWRRQPDPSAAENANEYSDAHEGYPSRFALPYQPGMPLDNVLEESESVLSGSTNNA
ncbi:hypothetical protein BCV70DRAFT_199130 [Testicularia cyperi]|uniref:Meiotically up-regulated protein Msb1/Mug8 domain-containing protein n=1 Tax=Testicularia cyperi TaxID=1882483 RepID=A0A317XTN9_9BASI|nr:hypothetical protein BCV70DRAFT_199130 [Testicularia cyperi]